MAVRFVPIINGKPTYQVFKQKENAIEATRRMYASTFYVREDRTDHGELVKGLDFATEVVRFLNERVGKIADTDEPFTVDTHAEKELNEKIATLLLEHCTRSPWLSVAMHGPYEAGTMIDLPWVEGDTPNCNGTYMITYVDSCIPYVYYTKMAKFYNGAWEQPALKKIIAYAPVVVKPFLPNKAKTIKLTSVSAQSSDTCVQG